MRKTHKHCRICGKESGETEVCSKCSYFLKHGYDKETIKATSNDKKTNKIWEEDESLADDLADAYYNGLLDSYGETWIKKVDKKTLGYNTFADGIRAGLDIIMPMLDDKMQKEVKQKIRHMLINASIRLERMSHLNKKLSYISG